MHTPETHALSVASPLLSLSSHEPAPSRKKAHAVGYSVGWRNPAMGQNDTRVRSLQLEAVLPYRWVYIEIYMDRYAFIGPAFLMLVERVQEEEGEGRGRGTGPRTQASSIAPRDNLLYVRVRTGYGLCIHLNYRSIRERRNLPGETQGTVCGHSQRSTFLKLLSLKDREVRKETARSFSCLERRVRVTKAVQPCSETYVQVYRGRTPPCVYVEM